MPTEGAFAPLIEPCAPLSPASYAPQVGLLAPPKIITTLPMTCSSRGNARLLGSWQHIRPQAAQRPFCTACFRFGLTSLGLIDSYFGATTAAAERRCSIGGQACLRAPEEVIIRASNAHGLASRPTWQVSSGIVFTCIMAPNMACWRAMDTRSPQRVLETHTAGRARGRRKCRCGLRGGNGC